MDFASVNHDPADFPLKHHPRLVSHPLNRRFSGSAGSEGLNLEVELATDPSFLGPVAMEDRGLGGRANNTHQSLVER